jgi:hypothetical protein
VTGQKHAVFHHVQPFAERFQLPLEVRADVLAFARKLQQRLDVGVGRRDAGVVLEGILQALAILENLLAFLGLTPEIRRPDLLFQFF